MRALLILLLMTSAASAKDVALILNDQEQAAVRQVLDLATKANGLQIAPTAVYLLNKLNSAPEVTEHKAATPDAPVEEPKK